VVRSTTSTKPIWVVGKGVGVGEGSVGSLAMAESTNELVVQFHLLVVFSASASCHLWEALCTQGSSIIVAASGMSWGPAMRRKGYSITVQMLRL